ncbi:hypothetical protein WMF20_39935 [Sorangium sp. So ce834]|uniref:hypothetical protein n=1 Tax=Sorangium sp. So ce834 TaxID=3133321 RepID=UPI003F618DD0
MPGHSSGRAAGSALRAGSLAAAVVYRCGAALAQPAATPIPEEPAPVEQGPGRAPGLRGGAPLLHLGARDNALRTSRFGWTTSATTDVFGLGGELYGVDGERADMSFSLAPRYSFVSTKEHWAWVGTDVTLALELTDSDVPGEGAVPLADLPLQAAYNYTFFQDGRGLLLLGGPRLAVLFPTSAASQHIGVYARTRLGLGALGNVPLLEGAWLNGAFFSAGGSWQHLFSQATTPAHGGAHRPRQDPSGEVLLDERLSGRFLERDRLSAGLSFWVNVWGDLSVGTTWGLGAGFRDSPSDGECVQTVTGCVSVEPRGSSTATLAYTTFGVSLSYPAADIAWFELGYDNTASTVAEDGRRPSFFYSPGAQLYLTMTLFLDSLYAVATAPPAAAR